MEFLGPMAAISSDYPSMTVAEVALQEVSVIIESKLLSPIVIKPPNCWLIIRPE